MSTDTRTDDYTTFTEEERELFRDLKEKFSDDEVMVRICDLVLQSSPPNEEANS